MLATAVATSAAAQAVVGTRTYSFGLSGGLGLPLGDFGGDWDSPDGMGAQLGFGVAAHLGLSPTGLPLALRLEGAYHRFGLDFGSDDTEGVDAHYSVIAGTANGVVTIPTAGGVRPYLIGGVGMYRPRLIVSQDDISVEFGEWNVGFNVGGGLRFPLGSRSAFAEARFHSTKLSIDDEEFGSESMRISFVPIVFGIDF